uniref:Uncharacterized protein n=1 Tax=Arion vulgaris TaxID=1028688 RepID=A0A0B7B490_9EUPU
MKGKRSQDRLTLSVPGQKSCFDKPFVFRIRNAFSVAPCKKVSKPHHMVFGLQDS